MSGLVALFHRDGRPVPERAIAAMLDAVRYRGPDGTTLHVSGAVGLGLARLAVTPEDAHDQQPWVSPRTGCVVVADARLDNRLDLLAALPVPPPRSASDAEIILHAYEAWGLDAPARLLGDFAFLLWDPRHERLVCARDTSGQCWLYYRVTPRVFAAASEIHQLLQDPHVPVAPNEARIRHLLVPLVLLQNEKERPDTYYEGIYSVQAGHTLVVTRDSVRERRYWSLEPPAELRYRTPDEYAEHFRMLLFEAVQARLRSASPIGVLLSGGLDSTSVACSAQEVYRAGRAVDRGFQSFSLLFEGLDCDERDLIQDVVEQYGFPAHYLPHAPHSGWLRPEPASFQPSPLTRISELHALYGAAHRAGVRVLLTGDLADNCVRGSWQVFDSLLRHGRLQEFRDYAWAHRRRTHDSWWRIVGLYGLVPLLPVGLQKRFTLPRMQRFLAWARPRLLPAWMPEALRQELAEQHIQLVLDGERQRRFANWARAQEYAQLYPPEIARNPVGWPLTIWRPYADRRLHEFLLAIPPEVKFDVRQAGISEYQYAAQKQIVRRALRGILPERVRTRRVPTHYGSVFLNEVRHRWPLYERVFGPGARSEVAARGYVDAGRFWARLHTLRAGEAYENDFLFITRMVLLETWLRTFALPRPQLVTVPAFWGDTPAFPAGVDEAATVAACSAAR